MNVDLDQTFPEERDQETTDPFTTLSDDELAALEVRIADLLTSVEEIADNLDWYNDLDFDLFRVQTELDERKGRANADADPEDHS